MGNGYPAGSLKIDDLPSRFREGRFLLRNRSPAESGTPVRARLIERLNDAASAGRPPGVPLVSAPAGFGKTTLVFAASCIDIRGGIIKVRIDKMILRLASTF
jgi:hypothetical protein